MHEWRSWLPEDERALYERAGYTGGDWIAGRPALLAIDVTRAFTGSRPLPVVEAQGEFRTSCGERAWTALPAVRRLLDAFRAAAHPIVYTRADDGAQAVMGRATKRRATGGGNDFVELVAPAKGEYVCEKARASAFFGTPLDTYLRRERISTVVVCGGTTSGCVRASSVDAFSLGFTVLVAEDAVFDRALHPHLASLFDLDAKYATVLPAATIADQVVAA